ncbi:MULTISPECIES: zinc-binding dehydrogenase [unclassified Serratia (in: enterobacteria)]|uniref:zinc-binding dehydrogenase n=1 Tax=unclassified Serratia (in: enterobacteria) TaxID=2647522 RepID=UPI002ED22523|nr:zinc-binding dehydrogenase [Serratia sp. C2(2)]MEE4445273.1 zinc-binding dehydrogenase [Serratia sp. C2(1)]
MLKVRLTPLYVRTQELLRVHSALLFDWVREGKLKVFNGGEYPLRDSATAHTEMWNRKTSGKLVLIP